MSMFPALQMYRGAYHTGDIYHCRTVPRWATRWFTFSVKRDPYSRAVSLWWATTQKPGNDRYSFRKMCPEPDTLAGFVRWVATRPETDNPELLATQTEWLDGMRIDKFLRFECLDYDFTFLPFYDGTPEVLPRNNATVNVRKHWRSYMTSAAIEVIDGYYADDFDTRGYLRWGER